MELISMFARESSFYWSIAYQQEIEYAIFKFNIKIVKPFFKQMIQSQQL